MKKHITVSYFSVKKMICERKKKMKVLAEYDTFQESYISLKYLDGQEVHHNCCKVTCSYSKMQELVINRQDDDHRIYKMKESLYLPKAGSSKDTAGTSGQYEAVESDQQQQQPLERKRMLELLTTAVGKTDGMERRLLNIERHLQIDKQ